MLLTVVAAALTLAPPPVSSPATGDSLEAVKHVRYLLSQYYPAAPSYQARRNRLSYLVPAYEERCDGGRGDVCYADDPDAGRCTNFVQCHPRPDHMIKVMKAAAADFPSSGFLTGQAVYALAKQERLVEALQVAEACTTAAWWCEALRGYVLHAQAKDADADAAFRRALAAAPDSVRCDWTDATWLVGQWDQRGSGLSTVDAQVEASTWSCARRLALSDSIWWLADPLYSVAGNDRMVEHLARTMAARFYDEIRHTHPGSLGPERALKNVHARRVRRGPVDSYDRNGEWTSAAAARYHFVPDVGLDGLDHPTWRLESHLDDEGYTPVYGPLDPIPHQVARFRSAGALVTAVATSVAGTDLARAREAAASFVLSPGPRQAPEIFTADPRQPVVRFLGAAPPKRYVASLEVVTSRGVGWNREVLMPLAIAGPEVSDLLLYDASAGEDPGDLARAAAAMLGSTDVPEGGDVGVYWETYGAPAGSTLRFDVSVAWRCGDLVERLSRLLPGHPQSGRGHVTWTEPATGLRHASAVDLDLGELEAGEYTLVLTVAWGDGLPLKRTRDFTVR